MWYSMSDVNTIERIAGGLVGKGGGGGGGGVGIVSRK